MVEPFAVYEVTKDMMLGLEQVGSKPKFWFQYPAGRKGLFKEARPNTGEHWAERIAAEVAALLKLPHAEYDLATHKADFGVVSWSFLREAEGEPTQSLFLGNLILAGTVAGYPRAVTTEKHRRVPQHTVENVLGVCKQVGLPIGWDPPANVSNGADVMVGYLLLDAWIGNTDRHDMNWGWVRDAEDGRDRLAPTFDHASSLGRELADNKRHERLETRDRQATVAAYAGKAISGFYSSDGTRKLSTFEAFRRASTMCHKAAKTWKERLEAVSCGHCEEIIQRMPEGWMSPLAQRFAIRILETNRQDLLG